MKSYRKNVSLTYSSHPRPAKRLRQKLAVSKGISRKAKAIAPSGPTVANVMDVTYFLAKYLSGRNNVVVSPQKAIGGFSAQVRRNTRGQTFYQINLPHWDNFDLPVKGFDKYRIYREGVWHESCHVRYTPTGLFAATSQNPVIHDLVNIIEDRRIEDLGAKEWRGYVPERLYTQAYAWALRPSVDKLKTPEEQRYEAFIQRLLIGKYKGKLSKPDADIVEEVAKKVEDELKRIENEKNDYKIEQTVITLAEEAAKKLGVLNMQAPEKMGSNSSWEATFTEDYTKVADVDEKDVEKGMDEFFKEKQKQAKEPEEEEEDEAKPTEITKDDIEQAKKGSVDARNEYEKIQRKEPIDPDLISWQPVASQAAASEYRDSKFINTMNTFLQAWKEGYKRIVGKSGASFSVKEYIRKQDEPFITRLKQSVKGKKVLILADFSGSMTDHEMDYKRALISAVEVLNSIGSNLAFFTFGEDPAQGTGFFRVKTFEDPKWTNTHSAKLAALETGYGSTPTGSAYRALGKYIQKHKPDITVTVTDGEPDSFSDTSEMIMRLKKHTRMVAFGISAPNIQAKERMEKSLREQGYHKSFAVTNVYDIPPKLVNLLVK
ncbi:MAG: hypothetical protein ACPLZY_03515 [Candidatus Norongarragalinales archaeon]